MKVFHKKVKNESIFLILMFLITGSILIAVGVGALNEFYKINKAVDNLYNHPFKVLRTAHSLESRLDDFEDDIQLSSIEGDSEKGVLNLEKFEDFQIATNIDLGIIKKSYLGDINLVSEIETRLNKMNSFIYDLPKTDQGLVLSVSTKKEIMILSNKIESEINKIETYAISKGKEFFKESTLGSKELSQKVNVFLYIILVTGTGGVFVVGIALYLKNKKINKEHSRFKYANERLLLALDGTRAGIWDWEIKTGNTVFNERWAEILGYTLEELCPVSIKTWRKLAFKKDLKKSDLALRKHFTGESEYYDCEVRMRHKDGHLVWVWDRGKVVEWDENGEAVRMIGTHVDITEMIELQEKIQSSLEEKTYLLSEIHHRVKNNLAIISGLMELQSFSSKDEKVKRALQTNLKRIKSMALIHEHIYKSENFSEICLSNIIVKEVEALLTEINLRSKVKADIIFDMEEVKININQAVPLSMLINEIFNSEYLNDSLIPQLKSIKVSLREFAGIRRLTILFINTAKYSGNAVLGQSDLQNDLIGAFLSQIRGSLVVEHSKEGFKFIIEFKGDKVNGSAGNLVAV